eukprot:5404632-Pyramimonas_sp.AAC.1
MLGRHRCGPTSQPIICQQSNSFVYTVIICCASFHEDAFCGRELDVLHAQCPHVVNLGGLEGTRPLQLLVRRVHGAEDG